MQPGGEGFVVIEDEIERAKTKRRNLLWLESLWEGTSTTAREENQKEEVLAVFRELVSVSRSEREIREYVPWQPLW
jgi:hypothetical protein